MDKYESYGFRPTFMFREIMEEPETITNTVSSVISDVLKVVNLIKKGKLHTLWEAGPTTMLQ